jgi:Ser/Thr protein kinase RdoA (MazF antagonist)
MTRIDWLVVDLAKSYQQFGMNRFGMQPARISSFLAGYEAMLPLDQDEVQLIPSVWLFLTLRRVVVYWDRYLETGQHQWLREAQRKLDLAKAISGATDKLSSLVESR